MGLDTSHGCWHGAYSSFGRFRSALAKAAGFLFVPDHPRTFASLDWGSVHAAIGVDLAGKWPSMPVRHDGTPEPLIVLLAHSDCDGEIQADMCGPLADRIEELMLRLDGEHVEDARRFVAGLRLAAAAGEPVDFH